MAWRERIPPQHEDHEGAWAYDPAGAAVPRGSDHRITRGGVTAFQRLTTLEPAGISAASRPAGSPAQFGARRRWGYYDHCNAYQPRTRGRRRTCGPGEKPGAEA